MGDDRFSNDKFYAISGEKLNKLYLLCESINKGKCVSKLDIAKAIGEGIGIYWQDEWITVDID